MSYVKKHLEWHETTNKNYVVRHWLGHLSLTVSYWINGALVPFVVGVGGSFAFRHLARTEVALQWLALFDLIYIGFSTALWIWSIVGIWRSAGYHEERGGSAGWANIARALVFLGALGSFLQSHNRFLYLVEESKLAFGDDPIGGPANIAVAQKGNAAMLDGNLTAGTAERLKRFVESHPEISSVILRSNGGRTLEADRMAKLIRRRGLNTEAEEYCMSACTLLLLAGRERTASSEARIGFHQPYFPGLTIAEQGAMTNDLRNLYVEAGVDRAFLEKALSVSPQSMWFPSVDELIAAKVITTSPIVVRSRSKLEIEMRDQHLQRYLDYTAGQINAAGSIKLDELTTRTGASTTPHVLTIRFRLGTEKSQVDTTLVRRKMTPVLTNQVCSDRKMSLAVDAGATFIFSYSDRHGNGVFKVPVSSCETE